MAAAAPTAGGSAATSLLPVAEWPDWVRELADPGLSVQDGVWPVRDPSPEELAEWYRLAEDEADLDAAEPAARPVMEVPWSVGSRRFCDGVGFGNAAADRVTPGSGLAGLAERAWADGLGGLSDDELGGLILAWRRLGSWAAAGELAGLAELDRRRRDQVTAGADSHLVEHVADEVAALLRMTTRGAGQLLDFADGLARLPKTAAALAAGEIDRVKALAVTSWVVGLTDDQARAVEDRVLGRARPPPVTMTASPLITGRHRGWRTGSVCGSGRAASPAAAARQPRVILTTPSLTGRAGGPVNARWRPCAGGTTAPNRSRAGTSTSHNPASWSGDSHTPAPTPPNPNPMITRTTPDLRAECSKHRTPGTGQAVRW
ncbi:MAG TPA: DUF222 domain-containing protein [Streptosporangiaceae bacterium]|nr:DUF222 domain-containing protein [Streptosporangiaceae bacterium]